MKEKIAKYLTLDNILYLAVSLYILDVILLGTGDLIRIAGISTRMVFFFISCALSIPAVFKNLKVYIKNSTIITVGIFMCVVAIAMVVGIVNNNYRMILLSDVKGFLNFLIVIPMTYILSSKERLVKLMKLIFNCVFVVSIICIILSYYQFFPLGVQRVIYESVHKFGFAAIAELTDSATRIFMHSGTRMFTLGLLLGFAILLLEKEKKGLRYLQMGCCLVATFMSYARALYAGLFVTVVVMFVLTMVYYKEYLKYTIKSYCIVVGIAVVIITMVAVSQQSNLYKIAINRCLVAVDSEGVTPPSDTEEEPGTEEPGTEEPGTEEPSTEDSSILDNIDSEVASLEIRAIRKKMAIENFLKSPVYGNGLGVVNDPNNGYIEYFYLDLLSKMGIIGLVLFVLPAGIALFKIITLREKYQKEQRVLSLIVWCDLLFLMFISYFNPCMNTSTGLVIYALAIALSIPWGSFNMLTIERKE